MDCFQPIENDRNDADNNAMRIDSQWRLLWPFYTVIAVQRAEINGFCSGGNKGEIEKCCCR